MPAMDTAAAVSSVAARINISRVFAMLSPRLLASSSARLNRFIRQRSSINGTNPSIMGSRLDLRSSRVISDNPPISQKVMEGS